MIRHYGAGVRRASRERGRQLL